MTTWTEDQKLAALLSAIDGNPNADALQMIADLPAMQAANRAQYEAEKSA